MSEEGFPEADSRLAHVTGVVLCAGPAEPLHALRFGEHSLAERVAALLVEIVHDVVWVGAEPPSSTLGRAVAPRPAAAGTAPNGQSQEHALWGVLEALPDATVLVVSADRPLLSPDVLIGLAGRPAAAAAVPREAGATHLLCARYDAAAVLPELRRCMADDDPTAFLAALDVQWLEGEALASLDPDGSKLRRVESVAGLEELAQEDSTRTLGLWPGHPGLDLITPAVRSIGPAPAR